MHKIPLIIPWFPRLSTQTTQTTWMCRAWLQRRRTCIWESQNACRFVLKWKISLIARLSEISPVFSFVLRLPSLVRIMKHGCVQTQPEWTRRSVEKMFSSIGLPVWLPLKRKSLLARSISMSGGDKWATWKIILSLGPARCFLRSYTSITGTRAWEMGWTWRTLNYML